MSEKERISEVYARRSAELDRKRYSWFDPATAGHLHSQERAVLRLLTAHGLDDLSGKKVLEVGCGGGSELRNFLKYGAEPENIHGVDLLGERVQRCAATNPNLNVIEADARSLPYAAGEFDLVCQFVMFTSILDSRVKRDVAAEMLRVARPGGLILWYDYHLSKPGNRDARGVGRQEIMSLFPGCGFDFRRVTLAAPLNRAVAPRSHLLAELLEKVPFLRSHHLVAIKPPAGHDRERADD